MGEGFSKNAQGRADDRELTSPGDSLNAEGSRMGKVTSEDRRQVFLAQEQARRTIFARMSSEPAVDVDHARAGRWLQWTLRVATILALLSGAVVVYEFVEFHPPTSLAEAFMPRR